MIPWRFRWQKRIRRFNSVNNVILSRLEDFENNLGENFGSTVSDQ